MNNSLRTLMAALAIGVTMAAAPAFSSELESMHVSVPFAFTAGTTSLPAGDYTVVEGSSHVVMIRGSRGSAILLAIAGGEAGGDKSALSFERTGKGYYLKSVHSFGRPASVLPVTPGER